jgi:enterochelin esterase-like enzyme
LGIKGVGAHYPVLVDRANTAIAGLSMGGAHTLEIAFSDLGEYSHVGVYSSGVFGINESNAWETAHNAALDDAALKNGLELVWFATGSEDFLLDTSEATVAMLEQHGFDVSWTESGGGHTWINWREYLLAFAPQLFQ